VEVEENKALRLACIGETDYERALAAHRNDDGVPPLVAALKAKDEVSAEALLNGWHDPNEVDQSGQNALHVAAEKGCRLPLFNRILAMVQNVNAVTTGYRSTALILAAANNHIDVVISLMNHPEIDLNFQGELKWTAMHHAVGWNHPAIVTQLLSDERTDSSLKDHIDWTPLMYAIPTAAELADLPRDRRYSEMGNRMYPLVHKLQPRRAPKITGMFLENEDEALLELLQDPAILETRVNEAIEVLKAWSTRNN